MRSRDMLEYILREWNRQGGSRLGRDEAQRKGGAGREGRCGTGLGGDGHAGGLLWTFTAGHLGSGEGTRGDLGGRGASIRGGEGHTMVASRRSFVALGVAL